MSSLYDFFQLFGAFVFDTIWFPVLVWSAIAAITFLVLKRLPNLDPLYHYHIRVATLFALPTGLMATYLLNYIQPANQLNEAFSPIIIIFNNPIGTPSESSISELVSNQANWMEPNFLIGFVTFVFVVISILSLIKLMFNYTQLHQLQSSLHKQELKGDELSLRASKKKISVAYHPQNLSPFTFGWRAPLIVLPESLKQNDDKVQMAVQHELIHIKRGDYLLNLALSVIQSLFWFHPLVRFGNTEIETYREVSCDIEVLRTTDVNPKNYAQLLLELITINRGHESLIMNMALNNSTIKKRIETMKQHNIHKSSFKHGLSLLLIMTLAIVAPIACTDMRNSDQLAPEELNAINLNIDHPTIFVNGNEVATSENLINDKVEVNALSGMGFNMGGLGTLILSTQPFEGGKEAGRIQDETINLSLKGLSIEIQNKASKISDVPMKVWAKLYAKSDQNVRFMTIAYTDLQDGSFESKYGLKEISDIKEKPTDEEVFIIVENMPELIGGMTGLQSKVNYPQEAIDQGIEGRVTVQFVVSKEGDVIDPKVVRGIGAGCDEEALRVVSEAKFKPGEQRGRKVALQMSLPILFKLTDSEF